MSAVYLREAIRANLAETEAEHVAAGCYLNESVPALVQAIDIVLVLHGPTVVGSGASDCRACFTAWPCETLRAIAEALGVSEGAQ